MNLFHFSQKSMIFALVYSTHLCAMDQVVAPIHKRLDALYHDLYRADRDPSLDEHKLDLATQDVISFLSLDPASKEAKNCTGQTPLMVAARWGFTPIVQVLIAQGADKTHADHARDTAITLAQRNSSILPLLAVRDARFGFARARTHKECVALLNPLHLHDMP